MLLVRTVIQCNVLLTLHATIRFSHYSARSPLYALVFAEKVLLKHIEQKSNLEKLGTGSEILVQFGKANNNIIHHFHHHQKTKQSTYFIFISVA
jgi:hypothetical protein